MQRESKIWEERVDFFVLFGEVSIDRLSQENFQHKAYYQEGYCAGVKSDNKNSENVKNIGIELIMVVKGPKDGFFSEGFQFKISNCTYNKSAQ